MESLTQKNVEATASLKLGKGNLSFGALLGGEVFFNPGAEGFRQLDWTFYACPTASVGTGVATMQPRASSFPSTRHSNQSFTQFLRISRVQVVWNSVEPLR